jgi:hypothetical protein
MLWWVPPVSGWCRHHSCRPRCQGSVPVLSRRRHENHRLPWRRITPAPAPEVAAELELLALPAAWPDAALYARAGAIRCRKPIACDALSRCARYSMPTTAAVTVRPNRVAKQAISPAPPPSLGAGRAASSASRFIFVFLAAEITDGRQTDDRLGRVGSWSAVT